MTPGRASTRAVAVIVLCATFTAAGCGTTRVSSDFSELAKEQERCGGYWRRSGDPDRAAEMDRRAMETRRLSYSYEVDLLADFMLTGLLTLLLGPEPPQTVKQAPHPSDPRGCE